MTGRFALFDGLFSRSASASTYAAYLRRASADPAIQALRSRAQERLALQRGQVVADVGCGPGGLVAELALRVGDEGRVIAMDRDPSMVFAARGPGPSAAPPGRAMFHVGDCAALPLRSASLDAYYCERVLQHVRDPGPAQAIGEALRALKPGGRLAIADTDWTTLLVHGDETGLAERVAAAHHARFPNPSAGARLEGQLLEAGASDVRTERFVVTLASEASTGLMTKRARSALVRGVLSGPERRRWRSSMARARAAGLSYGRLAMILATGQRPT